MIKCNVTLCGTISRDASVRTGKDGKEFVSFPLQVSIPGKNGNDGNMEVSVSKDGGQDTVHEYRYGSRAKVTGTLLLKRRGEKLYFNLSADSVDLSDAGNTDSVKGQMVFRGKTGKHIEERKDKTGKPYLMFSAFSTEKVNDGFEYQWVRFFCFGKERRSGCSRVSRWTRKEKCPSPYTTASRTSPAVWKNSTSMCRRPATITDDGYGRLQTTERGRAEQRGKGSRPVRRDDD